MILPRADLPMRASMGSSDSSPPTPATRASRRLSSHKSSHGGLKLKPEEVAVAGVGAALLLVAACCCFCCCRSKKRKSRPPPPPYLDPAMRFYADTSGFRGDTTASYSPTPPRQQQWRVAPALPDTDSTGFSKSRPPPAMLPPPPVPAGAEKNAFSYADLAAATGGFSEANLLGQGGFGYVHRGELLLPVVMADGKTKKKEKEKVAVAVKQLKAGSGQGEREFQAEVDMISRVHHRHLVSLLGYCIAGHHRLLVYSFVSNRTLEHHLHCRPPGSPPMEWPTRLRIAVGAAKGIAYLHEDCNPRIIHRDIKSANILLDDDFEAKVADFGLAKLSHGTETHVSTRVMGTFGYLAPEYASSGKLTEKSDVFSYGVMLLELLTGRRPSDRCHDGNVDDDDFDNLVDWARPALARALADGGYDVLIDRRLHGDYDAAEAARVVACTAACVRHAGRRRPKMSLVVKALQGHVPLEALNVDEARGNTLSSVGSMPEIGNGGYRQLGSGSGLSSTTTASSSSSSSN